MAFIKSKAHQEVTQEERRAPRTTENLIRDLGDPNPVVRRWAARDLATTPVATGPLVERLKVEPDVSVREIILTSLTRLGDSVAVAGLVVCMRSEDAALRNEALEAMKQLPEEVAPIMEVLLRDTVADNRIAAVNILESLRHPHVEQWLIEVIERDAHVNVCAAAVDLLVEVGTPAAREALVALKARFRAEPYIQFAADLALRSIDEA